MKMFIMYMRKNVFFQFLLACMLLSCPVWSAARESFQHLVFPPLNFTPPVVERHRLKNGMQLFFAQDRELPKVSIYAMIRTGTIYEPQEKLGLAAIVAEVLRTGGTALRNSSELNEALEFLATTVEVDIEDEWGSAELWTLKDKLDASLKLFAEILRRPAFEQEKVELAKSQMLEMLRRRNDIPQNICNREFRRVLYGKMSPLARIPQTQTIRRITRDDLLAFYRKYFYPNNIMLAVTGDFETEAMLDALNAAFGDWQAGQIDFPDVDMTAYEFSPALYLIDKDVDQTSLEIGHLGIKADNPDYPAVRILDLILGAGGFSSRLFQKVRNERGLAYSVGSHFGAKTRDYGAFWVHCASRNDAVEEVIRVILDEVSAFLTEEVSARELEAAKNHYLNSYVFKFATVDHIVRRRMYYEYVGYPEDFLQNFRERVMEVTAADVLRAARTYLHPDKMKILAVGRRADIRDALASFGDVQHVTLDPVE
ncbi:peptidase M16 [candidate division KSB3 bacterium]|uniref:Peptidase M16 n=1 Tax=candidate division KSB3 bacterium TaxID=2044937 RepID=A0A2G6E3Y6_9BACT|nr:MAG: peptidase M16 [candidate division KSB3 bacterium]PIE29169.1 MAG: peptidase M16 [candidate division KSB3 bacterium]